MQKHTGYKIRFLPLFEDDLNQIIDYMVDELKNPDAATRFLAEVKIAIHRRQQMPDAFQPYPSASHRQHVYYRIKVKNYYIFYVIDGDVMEIRRLLYARRDLDKHLDI